MYLRPSAKMVIVAADINGYVGKISNGFDRHQKQTKVDYILTRRSKASNF